MCFSVLVVALFATVVAASGELKNRQDCFPSTCDCNEDGCSASSLACCLEVGYRTFGGMMYLEILEGIAHSEAVTPDRRIGKQWNYVPFGRVWCRQCKLSTPSKFINYKDRKIEKVYPPTQKGREGEVPKQWACAGHGADANESLSAGTCPRSREGRGVNVGCHTTCVMRKRRGHM
ncbi:hypothetical protein DFH07DRAFT_776772 [Mycena maculata]|uniref:Uncharacterized protein n=1 Tax=Mycena maculata TaxID=230809 RepID=A0AAD7N4S0_9AGAR|nr:hypothetical protein DFH07DRAFT_776772 [Mycena maculata]